MSSLDKARRERVRALNDNLRRFHIGGKVLLSSGLAALSSFRLQRVVRAVASFNAFSSDNDPHEEHDCASLEVEELRIIWKIDYYDQTMTAHSEDEADPAKTKRVLTIMLAEEY